MGNTQPKRIIPLIEQDPQFNQIVQNSVVNTLQPIATNYGMELGKNYGSQFGELYGKKISKQLQQNTQTFEQQFAQNFSRQFMTEFSKSLATNMGQNTPNSTKGINIKPPSGVYIPGPIQNSNYATIYGQ